MDDQDWKWMPLGRGKRWEGKKEGFVTSLHVLTPLIPGAFVARRIKYEGTCRRATKGKEETKGK